MRFLPILPFVDLAPGVPQVIFSIEENCAITIGLPVMGTQALLSLSLLLLQSYLSSLVFTAASPLLKNDHILLLPHVATTASLHHTEHAVVVVNRFKLIIGQIG